MRCASAGTATFAPIAAILPSRMITVAFSIIGPLTGYTRAPTIATTGAAWAVARATGAWAPLLSKAMRPASAAAAMLNPRDTVTVIVHPPASRE